MSLLRPCVTEINKYSFLVKDITTQETYDTAGVDLTTATAATLIFKDLNDGEEYEFDILSRWEYLLGDGITINISEFPDGEMGGYDYFPDWMYETTIEYTWDSKDYSPEVTTGFRVIITKIVNQQLQQSDWVKELKCNKGCEKYSTTSRKYSWLGRLTTASNNCLIDQYTEILTALYRLTGNRHEYDED